MTAHLKKLQLQIEEGLYLDNLRVLISLCDRPKDDNQIVLLYILRNIFVDLHNYFEDRPVDTQEFDCVEAKLKENLIQLIEEFKDSGNSSDKLKSLSKVIKLCNQAINDCRDKADSGV
jgi:hypothetical protein